MYAYIYIYIYIYVHIYIYIYIYIYTPGIGGEVRHDVPSGVSRETSSNRHATPQIHREYSLIFASGSTYTDIIDNNTKKHNNNNNN